MVQIKRRVDAARSDRFRDVVMRGYYDGVQYLIDDLTQFRMLAISEDGDRLSEEIQNQIDELRSVLANRN